MASTIDVVIVKSGEKVSQSGHYKYSGHIDSDKETGECTLLPAEEKRFFTKGINAHGIVACNHLIEWTKVS